MKQIAAKHNSQPETTYGWVSMKETKGTRKTLDSTQFNSFFLSSFFPFFLSFSPTVNSHAVSHVVYPVS